MKINSIVQQLICCVVANCNIDKRTNQRTTVAWNTVLGQDVTGCRDNNQLILVGQKKLLKTSGVTRDCHIEAGPVDAIGRR